MRQDQRDDTRLLGTTTCRRVRGTSSPEAPAPRSPSVMRRASPPCWTSCPTCAPSPRSRRAPSSSSSLRERLMAEADTVLVRQPPAPPRLAMPDLHAPPRPPRRRPARRRRARRRHRHHGGRRPDRRCRASPSTASSAASSPPRCASPATTPPAAGPSSPRPRPASPSSRSSRRATAAPTGSSPTPSTTFTEQSGDGVRSLLTAYDRGGSEDDVQAARDFTATSMERLTALQYQLPAELRATSCSPPAGP